MAAIYRDCENYGKLAVAFAGQLSQRFLGEIQTIELVAIVGVHTILDGAGNFFAAARRREVQA